ncbi:MAG: hypothetical protein JW832_05740 [Deltaproteobacteria bacterium]|nr:hypothetical protein [Deltaproteobacteria bacterium]
MTTLSPDAIRQSLLEFFSSLGAYEIATMADLKIKVMLVDDWYTPIAKEEILTLARCNLLLSQPAAAKTQLADRDDSAMQLKSEANALYRHGTYACTAAPVPPAVAIVISQNHALNLFIEQDDQGKNTTWCIDASTPKLPITSDPAQAARMLKKPPVKLIYM